jgi:hypothetical protein
MRSRSVVPAHGVFAGVTPHASNCSSPRPRASRRTPGARPSPRPGRTRPTARGSRSARRSSATARAPRRVEGQAQLEEHVLQAHHAQAHRAPAQVGAARGVDRIEVEVDHAIELAHRDAHRRGELVEVERRAAVAARRAWPRLIEPRLHTAVSSAEVTSRISVHRFDRCTRAAGERRLVAGRFDLSLKVIQPLPVWASVRIMRAYRSRALTVCAWPGPALGLRVGASKASPYRSVRSPARPWDRTATRSRRSRPGA